MTPFYESPSVAIYNARWEDVWPTLGLAPKDVALCWADPPYGVNEQTNRGSKGRGCVATARDYRPVVGDNRPFDPASLLVFPRAVLWGANHYASRLPDSPSWWWWDKRAGTVVNDNADGELAWTNLGGPARSFTHMWNGMCRADEKHTHGLHPTQKPVALAEWGFQRAGLKKGDLVFSPCLGSGPEVRAALNMGLRIIGCEVDRDYCQTVVDHRVALAAPKKGLEGQTLLQFR